MIKLKDVDLDDVDAFDVIFLWEQIIAMEQFPDPENGQKLENKERMFMRYESATDLGSRIIIQIPTYLKRKEKIITGRLFHKLLSLTSDYDR